MKKSKVLVPALGILCLSTAAAVTGTVAWFTASRVETVTMSNITLVNPETGLAVEVAAKAGTVIDSENAKAVIHANDGAAQGYFRDGSVDVEHNKVYKAVLTDDDDYSGFAEVASPYKDVKKYDDKPVFFATSFEMTFKGGTNTDSSVNNSLFFSPELSKAEIKTANPESSYKALRIGMISADGEWFVWAPFAASSDTLKYVNGPTKTTNEKALTIGTDAIAGNAAVGTLPSEYDDSEAPIANATGTGLVNYLGVLPEDNTGIKVTVYTWYEGTDPNCVQANWNKPLEIASSLTFISRRVAA